MRKGSDTARTVRRVTTLSADVKRDSFVQLFDSFQVELHRLTLPTCSEQQQNADYVTTLSPDFILKINFRRFQKTHAGRQKDKQSNTEWQHLMRHQTTALLGGG